MVFKRYIYRNGKRFGPYYYHNKKVDGKVISTYVGTKSSDAKSFSPQRNGRKNYSNLLKFAIIILSVISLFLLTNLILNLNLFSTGNVPSEIGGIGEFAGITPDENKEIDIPDVPLKPSSEVQPVVNTLQENAIINQPVKWKKEINLPEQGKFKIQVPKYAENIVIYKINSDGQKEEITPDEVKITARASAELILDKSSSDAESPIVSFFKKIAGFFTGKAITYEEKQDVKEITIDEPSTKFLIEYQTPPPQVTEEKTSEGKKIQILSPIPITNVVAFTNIDESYNIHDDSELSLVSGQNEIEFALSDENSNGLIDKVEWTIPIIQNATYELIVITDALHLDSNKILISNIYPEVKELDDIWSEEISDKEYVRVTFEKNLTSENDITLFPRVISGNPKIEVYEKDSNSKLAEFSELASETYNTIYLSNLENPQDTFDLRVLGGTIKLDHVIDPVAQPGGAPDLRAQVCAGEDESPQGSFSGACDGVYPGACGTSTDLLSCNDNLREIHTSSTTSVFGGVRMQSYNSLVTNCQSITSVSLCYERWASATTITQCDISVDSNGGASYSLVTSTCPGRTANPGVTCTDVTSLEAWTCSNFFGSSGTRALAKSEFRKSGGGGARNVNWDVLFFNVTYISANSPPSITFLNKLPPQNPIENGITSVNFEIRVSDNDGVGDINDSSVNTGFKKTGEQARSGNCAWQSDIDAFTASYLCSVNMYYYDGAGTWNIEVNASDLSGASASTGASSFTYNSLKAIIITQPSQLNWSALISGSSNQQSSSDPTIIRNTGNYEGQILVNAKNLLGLEYPSELISADLFSASAISGNECSGTQLQSDITVPISDSSLTRGSSAIEEIYYCLRSVPELPSQSYTAQGANSWIISI